MGGMLIVRCLINNIPVVKRQMQTNPPSSSDALGNMAIMGMKNSCPVAPDSCKFYRFPLIYGVPAAFGASARPMKPASAKMVSTYGAMSK